MSFIEVPGFTLEQRQLLIRRMLELDEASLSEADETLVEFRPETMRDTSSSERR